MSKIWYFRATLPTCWLFLTFQHSQKRDFSPLLRTSHHFLLFAGLVISLSTLTLNPPETWPLWDRQVVKVLESQSHHVLSSDFILMPSGRHHVATLVKTKRQAKSFSASTVVNPGWMSVEGRKHSRLVVIGCVCLCSNELSPWDK